MGPKQASQEASANAANSKRGRVSKENVARFYGGASGTWAVVGCVESIGKNDERVKIRRVQLFDLAKVKLNVMDFFLYEEEVGPANTAKKLKVTEVLSKSPELKDVESAFASPKSDQYIGSNEVTVNVESRVGPQGYSMKYRITAKKIGQGSTAVEVTDLLVATNCPQQPKVVGGYALTGCVLTPPLADGWPATLTLNAWPGSTLTPKKDESGGVSLPSEGTLVFCCGVKPLAKSGEYTVCDSSGAQGFWYTMFHGTWDGTKWEITQTNCNATVNKVHPQELVGHFLVIREKTQKSTQKTYIGNVSLCVDYPAMLPIPDEQTEWRPPLIQVQQVSVDHLSVDDDETDWLKSPSGRDSAVLKQAGESGEWGEVPAVGWANCTVVLDGLYKATKTLKDKPAGSKVAAFVYLRGKHKFDGLLGEARTIRTNDVRALFSSPDVGAEVFPHYMEVVVSAQGNTVTVKQCSAIPLKQQQIQNLSFLLTKFGAKVPSDLK